MKIRIWLKKILFRLRGEVVLEELVDMGLKMGSNCHIMHGSIIDPSHCWLICMGNNVTLAPNVHILAHDASTKNVLDYTRIGKVIIGDNVFIGASTVVLPGVSIGSNVVIGAGSVVTKNVPENSVAVGNPARVICSFDEYIEKQKQRMSREPVFDKKYRMGNISKSQKEEMSKVLETGGVDRMTSKLVSIIMPVYNVEAYIEQAVESACRQTYQNIEILVVNDGTKDNSIEKIQKLMRNDTRICVIDRENGGLSAARNTGMDAARGEYIIFFDSDDTISENLVEAAVQCAEKNTSDVVVFGFENVNCDKAGNASLAGICTFEDIDRTDTMVRTEVPEDFLKGIGYAWNKIYRTEFLRANGIRFEQGLSLIEDVIFNHSVFSKTQNVAFLSGVYYQYYSRERSTLSNQFYDNFMSMFHRGFANRMDILRLLYPKANNADTLLAQNYVNGVRFYYSMIMKFGQGKAKDAMEQVRAVLKHELAQEQIWNYRPVGIKNKIVKWCLKHRQVDALYLLYRLQKRGE